MLEKNNFTEWVADAYKSLYDVVALRAHPLADVILRDPTVAQKEKGWQLHNILLNVIRELEPGPNAPVNSREWRRYQLMNLRYIEALESQAVADQLAITRRHFYRERDAAIETVAQILWDRYAAGSAASEHQDLLRQEIDRAGTESARVDLYAVLQGVFSLLENILQQRESTVSLKGPESLPAVITAPHLIRQLLMSILGYLIQQSHQATIELDAQHTDRLIQLTAAAQVANQGNGDTSTEQLDTIMEIAAMARISLAVNRTPDDEMTFALELATEPQRTVLIIDDNEDMLALYRGYLRPHGYRVIGETEGTRGLQLAQELDPMAIFLDLMMPDQDGWDILQKLRTHPATDDVPVIVCSILPQRKLALSLGASGFIEKPITEQILVTALDEIQSSQPSQ